jgi:hypothetical protein
MVLKNGIINIGINLSVERTVSEYKIANNQKHKYSEDRSLGHT